MRNIGVWRWPLLFALTVAAAQVMRLAQFPATALLGSMFAAIAVAINVEGMRLPAWCFQFGQGIIGMMIGSRIPPGFFAEMQRSWPLFLAGVAWAIAVASLLGWILTRRKIFPGTTAVWGLSPGAASSMTIMSEAYGADIRIVAFMQYFRNVSVVVTTSLVALLWVGQSGAPQPAPPDWAAWLAVDPGTLLPTLALTAVAVPVAKALRIPSGSMLLPMFLGMACGFTGALKLETPPWLLSFGSMLVGWSIGFRFNRPVLAQIAHAVPLVAAAVFAMIGMCGLFSLFMWREMGIDPLTAYLAACPGGLDSVAIIAATAQVDISFVLAMHTARFLIVVLTGPFLARQIVKRVGGKI